MSGSKSIRPARKPVPARGKFTMIDIIIDALKKVAFAIAITLAASPALAHLTIFEGNFLPEVVGATGTGTLYMEYDDHNHSLFINATWSGLSGNTNNAHIHCCTPTPNSGTAGVALATGGILPGFPLGVTFGNYVRLIDLTLASNYSGGFVTVSGGTAAAAETRLINNLLSGNAYFNIHSTTFGGGEIRTFVTAVPEPEAYAMLLAGLALLGVAARRQKQRVA
jgi:CHRD domain/PEP-CTERM motif